jgi:hypothetical protein
VHPFHDWQYEHLLVGRHHRLVPRGAWVLAAHQALEALPRGRPRFRGLSPSSVGAHRRRISPRAASLALLGFILPGAFPFPKLGLTAAAPGLMTACSNSACCSPPNTRETTRARPPSALRGNAQYGPLPCAQSFKDPGSWLASCRGCRPLEVCVLIPPWRGFGPAVVQIFWFLFSLLIPCRGNPTSVPATPIITI